MDKYISVITLCNKKRIAQKIQNTLLKKHLIAGCQISKRNSTYWWNGKIEKSHEYHIEMKTKQSLFPKIKNEIEKIHDYETPEISCYELLDDNPEFLSWIDKNTN